VPLAAWEEASNVSDSPDVSVVIASCSGPGDLRLCLESLMPQAADAEIIVAAPVSFRAGEVLSQFPGVSLIEAPEDTNVFRLRSLGLLEARGRFVALTEDHCILAPRWLERLRAARADGRSVVGGPVDSDLKGVRARALFLVEYAGLLPGGTAGRAVSGVNAGYDRRALEGCRLTWQDVFCENEVHDALALAGHEPHRVEDAWVRTRLRMSLREALSHLFQGGRRFGGYRRSRSSRAFRLLFPLLAPAVPGLLLWRIFRAVAQRRARWLPESLLAAPEMTLLVCAWSAGELSGHLWPVKNRED
jgi:hypothetical protein